MIRSGKRPGPQKYPDSNWVRYECCFAGYSVAQAQRQISAPKNCGCPYSFSVLQQKVDDQLFVFIPIEMQHVCAEQNPMARQNGRNILPHIMTKGRFDNFF